MVRVNENYLKLQGSYLFAETGRRIRMYKEAHPEKKVISLGIGDVTLPLTPEVIRSLHGAVEEMADGKTFHGYGPDGGYDLLREAIVRHDFQERGCQIAADEIFVSDGAKSDAGNIQELFSMDSLIAVCDPVYPVYVESNVMGGRCGRYDAKREQWDGVIYLSCTKEHDFSPVLPSRVPDLIYLCSPNNPTGTAMTKKELQAWVDYARMYGSVILFDAAYEAYITRTDVPHSIYECDGARECAIEMRSFSKSAGFTGLRLGYTVIPKEIKGQGGISIHDLWARRQSSRFNGAPYIVQRAGEAVYSEEGRRQQENQIAYYRENARVIREGLEAAGFSVSGGIDSPYIWLEIPHGAGGWDFFDLLLEKAQVAGTPGEGFGPGGRGYFRLTAFGEHEDTREAVERIRNLKLM